MHQWVNYLNKSYINLYGPKIKIFKLDKTKTIKHELYLEEAQTGKIYLPPIELRALYDDQKWRGNLGLNIYTEVEQPIVFYVNFEDMVEKFTQAKREHVSNMYIKYSGIGVPVAQKINNIFTIWIGKQKIIEYNLLDNRYSTVRKLGSAINDFDDFEVELEGKNDLSINLIDFEKTNFIGRQLLVYSENSVYKNITDVVEIGDIILTNKYRLYEVQNASPDGEFGWSYTTWKIECILANVETINLPGDYIDLVDKNNYGLANKYKME